MCHAGIYFGENLMQRLVPHEVEPNELAAASLLYLPRIKPAITCMADWLWDF